MVLILESMVKIMISSTSFLQMETILQQDAKENIWLTFRNIEHWNTIHNTDKQYTCPKKHI
jgi:hypothetical protein